jgi:hypothetical protein
MPGTFTIRIKALFLTAIFAGNFFAVCRCSGEAAAAPSVFMGMNGKHAHCCCRQKTPPCKDAKRCPGMRAIKFNLLEKKAAATVQLSAVGATVLTPEYVVPEVEGRLAQRSASSSYLPPNSPPDRLALYQCYLI